MGRARRGLSAVANSLGRSGTRRERQHHAETHINATPAAVLDVLSDPEAVKRWFPLPCEFEPGVTRLEAGGRYATTGKLAGKTLHSHLEVREATERHVCIRLAGPVVFDLDADLRPAKGGGTSAVAHLSVSSGGGLSGRLLTPAASALLKAGALGHALAAIRKEAEARS